MKEKSIINDNQLFEMIKQFKEDLKQDLGEIKEDVKDVKKTLTTATMTIASHEVKLENQDKRIIALEERGSKTHSNVKDWLMILITLGALIVSAISILN